MRDSELLRAFVGKRDHEAFGQVVGRYVDMVYSAALRQVRDRELAEDVTQTVFVLLTRKAGALAGEDVVLSGWLLKSTRFVALNAIKYQARRRRHEREAAAMAERTTESRDGDSVWQQIAPMLDAALMRLRQADRMAVVLRYMQGKTNEEVGKALGLSEDAARKRIGRAVEELRGYFAGKGVTVAPAALEASLVAWAVRPAPEALAGGVTSAAQGSAQSALTRFVLKSRMAKVAQVAAIGVVAAGVGVGVWWFGRGAAQQSVAPVAAAQVAAPAAPPKPAPSSAQPQRQAYFEFQAVEADTGKPIPDVALDIRVDTSTSSARTDAEGKHRIYLPAQLQYGVQVSARKGNLVPMSIMWENRQLRGGMIPNYVLKMEKGTAIGGIIEDEQGKGIAGASVFLLVPGSESGSDKPRAMIRDYEVKTDAQGRWRCDVMPSQLEEVWVRLAHPQFVSDNTYGASGHPPMAKLRDMSAVMVLKKGLTVSGRVVDEMGKPVAGARVVQGSDRWGSRYPETQTDAKGEFRFANASPGKMVLTVQVAGFAPELKEVEVGLGLQPVELKLQEGKLFAARVVDREGKPVAGATVVADTWRKHRSIEWRTNTDGEGRFNWKDAPADEVRFHIVKEGYAANRDAVAAAGDEERIFTLMPMLRVRGRVTDAETGKPIERFRAVVGYRFKGNPEWYWDERRSRTLADGWYEVIAGEQREEYMIRIEADGYLPAVTPSIRPDSPQAALDVKLKHGIGTAAVVRLPDGKLAGDARVALVNEQATASVQNGQLEVRSRGGRAKPMVYTSGADGRVVLPPQVRECTVVVVHPSGCAVVKVKPGQETADIALEAWARIEGVYQPGGKIGAGHNLMAQWQIQDASEMSVFTSSAAPDASGKFTLEYLPAKRVDVHASKAGAEPAQMVYRTVDSIELKPGEVRQVTWGGDGRNVAGRVGNLDLTKGRRVSIGLIRQGVEMEFPDDFAELTPEARNAWYKEAYAAKPLPRNTYYSAAMEQDGTFSIDDVLPGEYRLAATVFEAAGQGVAATASRKVSVGEPTKETLDLGAVELAEVPDLAAGRPAPELELATLEGGILRLSDLRGKYVLLRGWSSIPQTGGQEKLAEVPNAVWEAYGSSGRLEVVNLMMDTRKAWGTRYVAKYPLKGVHAYMGSEGGVLEKVSKAYQYMAGGASLVAPDGIVVATKLSDQNLVQAIGRVMAEREKVGQ